MIPIRLETAEGKLVSDQEFLPDGCKTPAVVVRGQQAYVRVVLTAPPVYREANAYWLPVAKTLERARS
jgi:hypothetical protein